MTSSNNLENKIPAGTYWRVKLVCMKVQAHNLLEPLLEYNQDQTSSTNKCWLSFLPISELQKYYAVSD